MLTLVAIIGLFIFHEFYNRFSSKVIWPPQLSLSADEILYGVVGLGFVIGVCILTYVISTRSKVETRLATALNSTPVEIALFDSEDHLVFCNRECGRIYESAGVSVKPGIRYEDIVRAFAKANGIGSSAQDTEDWIAQRLDRRNNPANSLIFRHNDNQRTGITDFILDDGQILTLGLRVTELLAAEGNSKQQQKLELLRELAGSMAHDFNNTLTAVNSNLEVLRLASVDKLDDKAGNALNDAMEAVQVGKELTDCLLTFSRPRIASVTTEPCVEVVSRMGKFLTRLLGRAYRINLDLQSPEAFVHIDVGEFENALLNLVLNTRDAMPGGGEIKVSVRPPDSTVSNRSMESTNFDEHVMIQVTVSGGDVLPNQEDSALDTPVTAKNRSSDTGSGLSMVKDFAENANGYVDVTTSADGGTTVSILLPVDRRD